jgi:hypothetical protein
MLAQGGCPGWIALAEDLQTQRRLNGRTAAEEVRVLDRKTVRLASDRQSSETRTMDWVDNPYYLTRLPDVSESDPASKDQDAVSPEDQLLGEGEDLYIAKPAPLPAPQDALPESTAEPSSDAPLPRRNQGPAASLRNENPRARDSVSSQPLAEQPVSPPAVPSDDSLNRLPEDSPVRTRDKGDAALEGELSEEDLVEDDLVEDDFVTETPRDDSNSASKESDSLLEELPPPADEESSAVESPASAAGRRTAVPGEGAAKPSPANSASGVQGKALDKSLFAPPSPARPRHPAATSGAAAGAAGSGVSAGAVPQTKSASDAQSRCEFVAETLYPSAKSCRTCHEQIYEEWSVSSHAYAAVSPMFHRFEQTINNIASGTVGYFCYRCHTPVGTSLGFSRSAPIWDAPQSAREGVTCVACHRVREMVGKSNGERRIEPGDIFAPVYGSIGGEGVARVASERASYKVRTSPEEKGPAQDMHAAGLCMPQLSASEFCASCHQVAVYPGIKLEVVWEQYRASPACKKGIRCQDCHMGRIPGLPSGFVASPAAVINKKPVLPERRHSNHIFYGPGYSIAHPGVFPFNPKADRWSMRDWLTFDWQAGWGTEEFEKAVKAGQFAVAFPEVWKEPDDRMDAREIVEANLKKKALKNDLRKQVMENGSHVDGPFFESTPMVGRELRFEYVVTNRNEGHNLPTASLGAQPQLWANVALVGPDGRRLWESGYLDRNGDLADIHSDEVRNKRLAFDWQLFNLQTMFLITGAKGTDREFYLPVNVDIDPLPFIRPAGQPISVLNHPPFIRMEARSLAPLGARRATYRVPAQLLRQPGRYRLSFRMRSRLEPLYFMRFCKSTPEMQRGMIDGTLDFHESSVEFDVR